MSNSRTYKVSFSRKSDEWETPQDLFDRYDAIHHFDLDVSATEQNAKCKRFFTKETDGLSQKWFGSCWCNPPYSNVSDWVRKAVSEMQNGVTTVMLVPARTDVKWFHDYIYQKPNIEIQFVRGRVKFVGGAENAPFPSMIVTFKGGKGQVE